MRCANNNIAHFPCLVALAQPEEEILQFSCRPQPPEPPSTLAYDSHSMAACAQGFWPDGLYTPPTAEAWAADIQAAKRLGYNTLRKHVKVEPEQCPPGLLLYPRLACRQAMR